MGMMKYSKQQARRAVQARLELMADENYEVFANSVRGHVSTLLAALRNSDKLKTALSYRASSEWREVDLSSLEREFNGVRFDYAPIDAEAPLPAIAYDVILVPLYGFNAEGYRLGHGGGWYDKFLATQPQAHKVGVGLEVGRVDFTTDPHDIPMDFIVTERGLSGKLPN